MVRAKFKLDNAESVKQRNDDGEEVECRTLYFSPVYSSDPNSENRKFWKSTPSGQLTMWVVNPEAWKHFEVGKSYYLDFSEAPAN